MIEHLFDGRVEAHRGMMMVDTRQLEEWQLSDEQVTSGVVDVFTQIARLEAEAARLTGMAIDRGLPRLAGNSSPRVWVANLTKTSPYVAAKTVRRAEQVGPDVAATQAAWAAGDINGDQAEIIATAVNDLPDYADAERPLAEKHLLQLAGQFGLKNLTRLANRILEVIDPDGVDEYLGEQLKKQEQKALRATQLELINSGDGMTRIRGLLPTAQASILRACLEGISSPRRESFQLGSRDEQGAHSDAAVGRLSHPERMGRAFLELLEHLPSEAMPSHGGLAASITISIDLDQLRDQIGTVSLSTGTDMSASQARRFACNANLIPMVLDGESKILDFGTEKRIYGKHQRIALAKRDKGCCWKGCNRPPAWCEAHHLVWHSRGGETTLDDGALFCFFHHHLLHDGEWDARMGADGIVEVIPPRRVDPQQKPLRHEQRIPIANPWAA